jgi:hypothetical protein
VLSKDKRQNTNYIIRREKSGITTFIISSTTYSIIYKMENNKHFTLSKINLILIAIGFAIIVLGFALMTGSTTIKEFNPDIYSFRRITVAPMISLFGFVFIIFAILFKPKTK